MANALFDVYKEYLLFPGTLGATSNNAVDLETDTIKVALIDHGVVTPNVATHDYWDDLSAAEIGTAQTLASKTNTNGVFDAANVAFSTVSGNSAESIVIYKDTGTASTSMLLVYLDTNVTGLPVTPSGGDINLNWDASGIFSL